MDWCLAIRVGRVAPRRENHRTPAVLLILLILRRPLDHLGRLPQLRRRGRLVVARLLRLGAVLTRVLAIAFNLAAAAGHAGEDAAPPSPHLAVRLHILMARSHRRARSPAGDAGQAGLDSQRVVVQTPSWPRLSPSRSKGGSARADILSVPEAGLTPADGRPRREEIEQPSKEGKIEKCIRDVVLYRTQC